MISQKLDHMDIIFNDEIITDLKYDVIQHDVQMILQVQQHEN